MKLASIFFKTNGSILERQLKDTKKTNEKYEADSNIFQNERKYLGASAQRYEKTNEKYEAGFNIFQNERKYLGATAQRYEKDKREI